MKNENTLKGYNTVLLILVFTFSLVFTIVFCFNDFAQAEKVTLTVWEWTTNERPEAVEAIVKAFEAQNPDIHINLENTDWNSMSQKSVLAGEAGAMPDCLEISPRWAQTLSKRGYLEDLQPFIDKEPDGFLDSFISVPKDPWTNTYSYLPYRGYMYAFYVIEEYLREAGFTEVPKTWEEFEEVVKKCTIKGTDGKVKRWGFVSTMSASPMMFMLINSFGGVFENPDGTSGLGSPEVIAAMKYMKKIEQNYAPEGIAVFGYKESRDIFMAGKAAITAEGNFIEAILQNGMVPGLTWKPFLSPIKDVPTLVLGSQFYGIGKGTKHPEEAWKFLKFVTGPEGDALMVKLGTESPIHKVNLSIWENSTDPRVKLLAEGIANAKRIDNYNSYKTYNAFYKYHVDTLQKILYDKMTVEEAMKELAKKIDEETAR